MVRGVREYMIEKYMGRREGGEGGPPLTGHPPQ